MHRRVALAPPRIAGASPLPLLQGAGLVLAAGPLGSERVSVGVTAHNCAKDDICVCVLCER